MTPAQLAALKANILATPEALALYNSGDLGALANFYNADASPVFTVWRNGIDRNEIGKAVLYVAVANLTSINQTRVTLFLQLNNTGFSANQDIDAMLADVFSGALGGAGAQTRTNLAAMLRRPATRLEKLFAAGTGSTASPASVVVEGAVSYYIFVGL